MHTEICCLGPKKNHHIQTQSLSRHYTWVLGCILHFDQYRSDPLIELSYYAHSVIMLPSAINGDNPLLGTRHTIPRLYIYFSLSLRLCKTSAGQPSTAIETFHLT